MNGPAATATTARAPTLRAPTTRAAWGALCAILAALSVLALCLVPAQLRGDSIEYTLTAMALADHATPDVRAADTARAARLIAPMAPAYAELDAGVASGRTPLHNAFMRGADGKVYELHFFAYPALAALPMKLFAKLGVPVLQAFEVVNLALVCVLGLALFELFGSLPRALAGLALFMLSGGILYWTWTSPECMSAAALLAGLLFYTGARPVLGALLAALAAMQNPTIMAFFAFAPLLKLGLDYQRGAGFAANLRDLLRARLLVATLGGALVAALPLAFSLAQFGVPNLAAKLSSDPGLVNGVRLVSLFFDLNQGMLVGVPAIAAALLCWGWRGAAAGRAATAALALAFTLALTLPTLAVYNWNSDAAGVMRYAFWGAMPLLFALLRRLRDRPRWPLAAVAVIALAQGGAMLHAASYGYLEFSPLARLALRLAPTLYHPEPEIFVERGVRAEIALDPTKVFTYRDGAAVKTLYNAAEPGSATTLCGPGALPSARNHVVASSGAWRYIDGVVDCEHGGLLTLAAPQFGQGLLAQGWNSVEFGGGNWDGVWSNGASSRLEIALPPGWHPAKLELVGMYIGANRRTRVSANGVELGWFALDTPQTLILPASATGAPLLEITLAHEAPLTSAVDPRALALFLRSVRLH